MTAPLDAMKRLADELGLEMAGFESRLSTFSSGSAMLDVRGFGRAFVMVYQPAQGFAVDELGPDDAFNGSYRYTFAEMEPAVRTLRALVGMRGADSSASLSLIVLRARDVETAKQFYSSLGLTFAQEKHGNGPSHYATELGSFVFEIYPCRPGQPNVPLRLGFRVRLLDGIVALLRERGTKIVSEVQSTRDGFRAVVEDPDGNVVELLSEWPEPKTSLAMSSTGTVDASPAPATR